MCVTHNKQAYGALWQFAENKAIRWWVDPGKTLNLEGRR